MDTLKTKLDLQFGSFPEPVVLLDGDQILYTNGPGQRLLKDGRFPQDLLAALAEHPRSALEIALAENDYRVTVSPLPEGDLLVLRPMPKGEAKKHPFSNAIFRMRECLSNLNAIQAHLSLLLSKTQMLDKKSPMAEELEKDLAHQNQLLFQMLRLTRQAELTQDLNNGTYPMEEGFDLAAVCQGMADEATMLADLMGVRFRFSSNVPFQAYKGSKSLLTQMLLALVSNSVRAAGQGGTVEMNFHSEAGRCVISLRDTGMGIPEDRMSVLFSGDVPEGPIRGGEGAGLGLYNAQRIAALHGGVLVAQSSQEGGTCLVVSLPIRIPGSVPLRNNPGYDNLGGYSPLLIELSDMLPWWTFRGKNEQN